MFRLAHLSDPHLGPLPAVTFRQLASKRVVGYINWTRNRAVTLGVATLTGIVDDMLATTPDHIAVTGDLVNIALPEELAPARAFLDGLGKPENVSVVPGNHDAYVPGAFRRATEVWAPFMQGDGSTSGVSFPYVRRRGKVAIVGVSTARASAPFLATGYVSESQALLLTSKLAELRDHGFFRVVLIHHPPIRDATEWHKRLVGGSRVRAAVLASGAELVLHGHTHLPTRLEIPGPNGPVPVIGVPAASQQPGGSKPAARWNQFEIDPEAWTLTMVERGYGDPGSAVTEIARRELAIPARAKHQSTGLLSQA